MMDLNILLKLIRSGESDRIEFKRSIKGEIHKEIIALANANGGKLLVGVDDDGDIIGADVKKSLEQITNSMQSVIPQPKITTERVKINGKEVLVIDVEKSDKLCSIGGIAYIRIGTGIRPLSIQEVLMLSAEIGTLEWDRSPVLSFDNADPSYIDWFFERLKESRGRKIAKRDRMRYLRSIGALREKHLTNAGVLFFTDATEFITQSKIRIVYMEKGEPVGSKEYSGPIWKMIDDCLIEMQREVSRKEFVISSRRIRVQEYPIRAIREAIINAVAHRNYTIQADIRIFIEPDRLSIKNPGGLLPGVDLDDPEHMTRNPSLCNLLFDTGFIERYGYGITMMKKVVEGQPGLKLNFDIASNRFKVEFIKEYGSLLDDVDTKILEEIGDPMKSSDISEIIGISKQATLFHLKKLQQLDLVKKQGRGPQVKYVRR